MTSRESESDIWSWSPPAYVMLPFFEPTDPAPFFRQPPIRDDFSGIILHWALPDGLTQGSRPAPGGDVRYPPIPNRWLLTRKARDPADPRRWAFTSTMIASDYVGDTTGSPYPNKDGTSRIFIGTSWPLEEWPGEAVIQSSELELPLTAVGPGDATFAAFAPNVRNVLAFADPLAGVGIGPISYALYGWHADPATDPLFGADFGPDGWQTREQWDELMSSLRWFPDTRDELDLERATEAAARWAADHHLIVDPARPRTQYPARTICHGLIADIAWLGPDGPKFSGVPTSNDQQAGFVRPRIAVGNSAADALAAMIGDAVADQIKPEPADQIVEIVAALQAGLLTDLTGPDGQARLEAGLQAGWFGTAPGGTQWRVVAPEAPDDPAGREAAPALTDKQAGLLSDLEIRQRALDERLRQLADVQSQVGVLWWKREYIGANSGYEHWQKLVDDATAEARSATLSLIAECRWLRQQRDALLIALTDELGPLRLSGEPGAPFRLPNEPVLLISGARRGFKHGEDGLLDGGRLACRFTGQAVSGIEVTIGDHTYVVQGRDLPGPPLDGADLPAELPDLAAEAMILDISNAPLIAFEANPADPWSLLGAIRRVQSAVWNPAVYPVFDRLIVAELSGLLTQYGLGAVPSKAAVQLWSPPWSPLYLDWQIEYYPSAILVEDKFADWEPPADTNVPGPDDWSYRWIRSAIGPAFITIKGRTLLTPKQQGVLAAELERVVRDSDTEPELRPFLWAFREARDYLIVSDLLCQSLSGFGAALLQLAGATFRTDWKNELAPYFDPGGVPRFVPASRPLAQTEEVQFGPLRAGHFRLDELWVVDDFGQVFDVFGAIGVDGRKYSPVRSPDLVTPGFPTYSMLRPRVSQVTRVELKLLSADRDDREVDPQAPAGATPLCGWLLAHPLEKGLLVYHADGTLAGELLLGGIGGGGGGLLWWPSPETSPPPGNGTPAVKICNRHLRGIVNGLLRHPDPAGALRDLLRLIADAASATDPDGTWYDEELPVPVGRPLAVIRARVRYQLSGEPASSQRWADTGQRVTHGFTKIKLPVRLGSTELLDDAVVGAYLNDDYQAIGSVYGRHATGAGAYVDDRSPEPALRDLAGTLLTMIVTPHGIIHAVTGLLPVLELTVPAPLTTPALRRMAVTLRTGPLIGDGTGTVLPLPAVKDSVWTWLQYTDTVQSAAEYPVLASDDVARLPDAAPVVREGWLKLLTGERPVTFGYAVTPSAVPCTTDEELPASATFAITVYNGTPEPVSCPQLVFALPTGSGERALTDHDHLDTVSATAPDGWTVRAGSDGAVVATPAHGQPVPPGVVLTFVIAGVQVVTVPGVAVIEVTESTDADRRARLAVSKLAP